jgi:hypothetical protein
LRRLRIAAPAQLTLGIDDLALAPIERWWSLPEPARAAVVHILAKMIATGVIEADGEVTGDDPQH